MIILLPSLSVHREAHADANVSHAALASYECSRVAALVLSSWGAHLSASQKRSSPRGIIKYVTEWPRSHSLFSAVCTVCDQCERNHHHTWKRVYLILESRVGGGEVEDDLEGLNGSVTDRVQLSHTSHADEC